jgi:F-type H+-transporting ATPase subunit alpha
MNVFRSGVRPAISTGLSVTRAGGLGHNKRQKDYAAKALKILADYRQAQEFSRFGSELTSEVKHSLSAGKLIYEIISQGPTETYSLMSQQLMFDIVLAADDPDLIDSAKLKQNVSEYAAKISKDGDFDKVRDELKAVSLKPTKPAAKPAPAEVAA